MKTKLKWRLGKLPTSNEVIELLKEKLITQEEAREILFNKENDDERDSDSLKSEITFLRGLVEKLSSGKGTTIYEYIYRYPSSPWVQPYMNWCLSSSIPNSTTITSGAGLSNALCTTGTFDGNQLLAQCGSGTGSASTECVSTTSFSDIKTF